MANINLDNNLGQHNRFYTSDGDEHESHAHLYATPEDDIFIISQGISDSDLNKTTHVLDFDLNNDFIELPKGLAFERLNIFQSTEEHSLGTVLSDKITGENLLVLVGVDSTTLNDSHFIASRRDPVLELNATLIESARAERLLPPQLSRGLAMMHTAIYDAVNGIDQTHESYFVKNVVAPQGASREAAVAGAGHSILEYLFPAQEAKFDAIFESLLADIPDGKSEDDGVALGKAVAQQIIAWRSNDETRPIPPELDYTPGNEPGNWQPTPPAFSLPQFQQWPDLIPWTLTSSSQFRKAGPPEITSDEYTQEFDKVKLLGEKNSPVRTPEQADIAVFWNNPQGTDLPPGVLNQIAEQAALIEGNSLSENARLFAKLNIAIADGLISIWDAKTHYDFWRPVTAIQNADNDGNPDTIGDANWTPLLTTPAFQEYGSAHSVVSGAASKVLAATFGDNFELTVSSASLPGVYRTFDSFSAMSEEMSISRLFGGVHFDSGIDDAVEMGEELGDYVVKNFLLPKKNPDIEYPKTVTGSSGADTFDSVLSTNGFVGNKQVLFTGSGDDMVDVTFAPGGNRIDLGSGEDIIFAGTNNRIIAGSGDDMIFVGSGGGNNIVTGGAGADQFWVVTDQEALPDQMNTISDFKASEGDLLGFANTNLSFGSLTLRQEGANAIITAFNEDLVTLLNTFASSLSGSSFVFA